MDAAEWLDMREALEYALERLQVKAVVIDEAQHLLQVTTPLRPLDQLNWLNSLTNHTSILHVLVGPYELYDVRNLSGQATRRGRDVHFPRYHLERKKKRTQFVGALRYLAAHAVAVVRGREHRLCRHLTRLDSRRGSHGLDSGRDDLDHGSAASLCA